MARSMEKFLFTGFLLALFVTVRVISGQDNQSEPPNISDYEKRYDSVVECPPTTVQCVCGIGESVRYESVELKAKTAKDPFTGNTTCTGFDDPYQACANISCSLTLNGTSSDNGKSFISNFYPKVFSFSSGDNPEGHRFARQSEPCHVTPLKNAEIKCYKWPNWMNCDINCIYGHALRVGEATLTSTNINCRSTENKWKPHGFYDCEPFLNCKVHLVKPGDLKCKQPTSGPTFCDISCMDYEDKEATARQRYECTDENFGRNLPHCAVLSETVGLVKKPK